MTNERAKEIVEILKEGKPAEVRKIKKEEIIEAINFLGIMFTEETTQETSKDVESDRIDGITIVKNQLAEAKRSLIIQKEDFQEKIDEMAEEIITLKEGSRRLAVDSDKKLADAEETIATLRKSYSRLRDWVIAGLVIAGILTLILL